VGTYNTCANYETKASACVSSILWSDCLEKSTVFKFKFKYQVTRNMTRVRGARSFTRLGAGVVSREELKV